MRAVVQRVSQASVTVGDETVGEIGLGLAVLVGVGHDDGQAEVEALADKLVSLRLLSDEEGRFNRSLLDVGGSVLVISQFTLLADVRKGRRPSFTKAAAADVAEPVVHALMDAVAARGITVAGGRFGAHMEVHLTNDGPATLVLEVTDGRVS